MLLNQHTTLLECGTDEAGRGCLAGPVTAAAVILRPGFSHPLLNDSKKLTPKQRLSLVKVIYENALSYAVANVSPYRIDQINILNASIEAMHLAIEGLKIKPEFILVDGNRFTPYKKIPYKCMIKGDGRFLNIAAASVLAKTSRDQLMADLHHQHPQYSWDSNKGYPTKEHRKGILSHGITSFHRKSFKLFPQQLQMEFS